MTSDELNSVMGKKSVIFKEKEQNFKKQEKKKGTYSAWRACWPKQTLELIQLELTCCFLTKKKRDFGRDMMDA